MNNFEELIAKYEAVLPDAKNEEFDKLQVIEMLENLEDDRILPFFLKVLCDENEYDLARVEIAKILNVWESENKEERQQIARALIKTVKDSDDDELVQQWAAIAFDHYFDIEGVYEFAAEFILNADKDTNARYNVLDIFEKDGPTQRTLDVFRKLLDDEEFQKTATRILGNWNQF